MKIRVLLVDDHTMMREGLRSLLAEFQDIEIVGECSDGRSSLDLVRTHSPDVVVMDIGCRS
jgi:DNA-binding NarL/FixJ family response regulator